LTATVTPTPAATRTPTETRTPAVKRTPTFTRTPTVTPIPLPAPDLLETALSNPPAATRLGRSFLVRDTVRNQGTAAAEASTTRYYLSVDTLKSVADKRLDGVRAVPGLAPLAASAGTVSVTVPLTTVPGTYFLLACADDTRVMRESDERNNCRAAATTVVVRAADLVETAISDPPKSISPGSSFSVRDAVRNQGTAGTGPTMTRYYLSLGTRKGGTDRRLDGRRAVPGLGPGGASIGSVTVSIPGTTTPGTYYLLACADDLRVAPESSETNNCLASGAPVEVSH